MALVQGDLSFPVCKPRRGRPKKKIVDNSEENKLKIEFTSIKEKQLSQKPRITMTKALEDDLGKGSDKGSSNPVEQKVNSRKSTKILVKNLMNYLSEDSDDDVSVASYQNKSLNKPVRGKPGRPPTKSVRKLFPDPEDNSSCDSLSPVKRNEECKHAAAEQQLPHTPTRRNRVNVPVQSPKGNTPLKKRANAVDSLHMQSPRKQTFTESDIVEALKANIPIRISPRKRPSKCFSNTVIHHADEKVLTTPSKRNSNKDNDITTPLIPKSPKRQMTPLAAKDRTPKSLKSPKSQIQVTPLQNGPRTPKRLTPDKCDIETPVKRTKKQLNFDVDENEQLCSNNSVKKCVSWGLKKQDVTPYQKAKKALHTSTPSRILCRENESNRLKFFLKQHLRTKEPGSLYVSGAPGTGKTACIAQLLQQEKASNKALTDIFINCMSVRQSKAVYEQIADGLDSKIGSSSQKEIIKAIEKKLCGKGDMVVIILDEMDQLNSKTQDVLYTIFEWPRLTSSRLILIGVANALDLTDRLLPRLHACGSKPELLHFTPYSQQQILQILQERLKDASDNDQHLFRPEALQFCARKIAASTGDVRKALDTCRRALEKAEKSIRTQQILKLTSDDGSNTESPRKSPRKISPKSMIGLPQINAVLHDIYNSRLMSSDTNAKEFDSSMPTQQKLLLCSLLLLAKHAKNKDITFGRLHEIHCRICKKRQVGEISTSEFWSLCDLTESRGLILLKRHKESRLSKVCLKTDQEELEYVMQDKTILAAVLMDTSVLKP